MPAWYKAFHISSDFQYENDIFRLSIDTCNETWEVNEATGARFTLITRPDIVGDKLNVDTLKMEVTYTEHDILFHTVSLSPSQRTHYVTGDAFHVDLGKELTTSYCNIQSHSQPLLRSKETDRVYSLTHRHHAKLYSD